MTDILLVWLDMFQTLDCCLWLLPNGLFNSILFLNKWYQPWLSFPDHTLEVMILFLYSISTPRILPAVPLQHITNLLLHTTHAPTHYSQAVPLLMWIIPIASSQFFLVPLLTSTVCFLHSSQSSQLLLKISHLIFCLSSSIIPLGFK